MTSTEVGVLLQVNPSSVKNWVDEGRINAFRTPGGHRRIRATDLVSFLESHDMPVPSGLELATRRRILVVDDDAAQLRAYQRAFRSHEARVQLAVTESGIDALVLVGTFRPHLILLDVYMPGLDGLEVCRRLKANPTTRRIGVVIASGNLTDRLASDGLLAGAQRCLEKPVETAVLLEELGVSSTPRKDAP